jgi:hypothetical protein
MAHDAFGLCARWGGPVGWEEAALDMAVKAGVGPIGGSLDEAVLHLVVVDVTRKAGPRKNIQVRMRGKGKGVRFVCPCWIWAGRVA